MFVLVPHSVGVNRANRLVSEDRSAPARLKTERGTRFMYPLSVVTFAATIHACSRRPSVVPCAFSSLFLLRVLFFCFVHSSLGGAADRDATLSVTAGDKLGVQQLLVAAVLGSSGDSLPEGTRLAGKGQRDRPAGNEIIPNCFFFLLFAVAFLRPHVRTRW